MDQERFATANSLWEEGHVESAAREYRAMAALAESPDEKAALLANEHKCYCQLRQFEKAKEVLRQIRRIPVQDRFVRMVIDFGEACMTAVMGEYKKGVSKFERILESYGDELQDSDGRNIYEEIQQRRGFALTTLERYDKALPVLQEATTFANASLEDTQSVWLYLGICYATLSEVKPAKEAYLRAIAFGIANATEADARYRIAILYFSERAFAQAKHHLEIALQLPDKALTLQTRRFIYQQMSRTCHYLGETDEEKRYLKLAQTTH
jgi:tetratricopeptide (TPR) repeat protein